MASTLAPIKPAPVPLMVAKRPVPPLENGDRLTHADYIERYARTSEKVKAERIEGVVYMPAAALSAGFHGRPHIHFASWLGTYEAATPGVAAADNSTVFLDIDNDPQPDACLYTLPSHGGRTTLTPEGYIQGAPELIVEIAASSMSYDLGVKFDAYRRNGVNEYIVFRTYDGEIDWFRLTDGEYHRQTPDAAGIIRSETFGGLWLDVPAMLHGKLAEVLTVLQVGIATAEHAEFVAKLNAVATRGSQPSPKD